MMRQDFLQVLEHDLSSLPVQAREEALAFFTCLLYTSQDGYADVSKGIGVIVIGLASIIVGEVLYSTSLTLLERLIAIVVGSILYQFLISAVIALGFNTNYLKLFSALVLALCLMVPVLKQRFFKGMRLSR